ncbi:hypothetical protein SRB17_49540 [Streptomyces sp. RB17]|nr:hypothetical protein [Streptomyces sp. RB17]
MHPTGSNGASQAILDTRTPAPHLATPPTVEQAPPATRSTAASPPHSYAATAAKAPTEPAERRALSDFDPARPAGVISPLRRTLLAAVRSAEDLPEMPDAQIGRWCHPPHLRCRRSHARCRRLQPEPGLRAGRHQRARTPRRTSPSSAAPRWKTPSSSPASWSPGSGPLFHSQRRCVRPHLRRAPRGPFHDRLRRHPPHRKHRHGHHRPTAPRRRLGRGGSATVADLPPVRGRSPSSASRSAQARIRVTSPTPATANPPSPPRRPSAPSRRSPTTPPEATAQAGQAGKSGVCECFGVAIESCERY